LLDPQLDYLNQFEVQGLHGGYHQKIMEDFKAKHSESRFWTFKLIVSQVNWKLGGYIHWMHLDAKAKKAMLKSIRQLNRMVYFWSLEPIALKIGLHLGGLWEIDIP
jgi:mannose/cellobiose epimerase-like protein (N-acyl-D-glucosamine 2-epimerase family)